MAEQTAAATQALTDQAQRLSTLVSRFKLTV
jgi:methyl-accepting chemotaxis protein